jgi:hypothetical protein
MERHSVAGGIMTEDKRTRVEAEEAGPEMVDVIPEEQWLEQTITELHARPHLWPLLQKEMKNPPHRRKDTPRLLEEIVREDVQRLADGGMKHLAARLTVAEKWNTTEREIREICWPQKRKSKPRNSTK